MPDASRPAEMVAAAIEWAMLRRAALPPEAGEALDLALRRLQDAAEYQTDGQAFTVWQIFAFRSMISSLEHADALARFHPAARSKVFELARQVCEWDFPATSEELQPFLDRQTQIHRRMSAEVRREIRESPEP